MADKTGTENTEKRITSINLPQDIYEEIAAEAKAQHRSFSAQVVFFLGPSMLRHNND